MLETTDLRDFSISSWYDKFAHIALKTILVQMPDELVTKFQSDDMNVEFNADDLKSFTDEFKNALNALNKSAFVKNNWHAPIDARMFSFGNNLQVSNLDDVILYFTSSTGIQEDFTSVKGVPFCIALKKWVNIHPAAEFRCIVVNNILRGITPRDWPTYYAHFKEEGPQIIEELTNFYNENIKLKFPRTTYTFDVVFSYPDKPYILDFGSLNAKANLYAFSWKEIQPLISKDVSEDIAPVFRYLETDIGIITRTDALGRFAIGQS